MIFSEKENYFDSFLKNWNKDEEYYLFGKSKECYQFIKTLNHLVGKNCLKIKGIFDFEQEEIEENNNILSIFPYYYSANDKLDIEKKLTLLPVNTIKNKDKIKIIVTTDFYRNKTVEYLNNMGLKEDIDFCVYKKISAIWPYKYNDIVHINRLDQTITTKCSLDCTYCNMYMPFYDKQFHIKLEQLKKDVDLLFKNVDFVSTYHLIGGEPLLYTQIDDIISYIGDKYRSKIDNLIITTNGTIKPKESTLNLIKEYNIYLAISDYTKSLPDIKDKVTRNIEIMKSNGIYCIVRDANEWSDFGDPRVEIFKDSESVIKHYNSCVAPYRGIDNGKFYYCNLSMSAEAAGLHEAKSTDYLDISKNVNKEELLMFDLGYLKEKYVSLCKSCNGCYTGIEIPVSPASQGMRK